MLFRSSVAAAVLVVALLAAGSVLVATQAPGQPNALSLSFSYLRYLFGAVPQIPTVLGPS